MTSMSSQYRIIAVCTGNICRSPMAELMLAEAFRAEHLTGAVVDSAGPAFQFTSRRRDWLRRALEATLLAMVNNQVENFAPGT